VNTSKCKSKKRLNTILSFLLQRNVKVFVLDQYLRLYTLAFFGQVFKLKI
jgi:hypothetical protein